jgi:multiple sugar transport system substrate-binding protein
MNSPKNSPKPTNLAFFLLTVVLITGCTFQTGSNPQPVASPVENVEAVTSTPASEADDEEESEEQPIGTLEAVVPEADDTPIPDPYGSIDPQGQTVYFWYYLPPQTQADIALNSVVDRFNENNPYDIFIDAYNQSTSAEIISRTLSVLNTQDVPGLVMTEPDIVYRMRDGLADLNLFINSPSIGFAQAESDNFNHQMITQAQYSGWSESQFAFPISRNVAVLSHNLEWLSGLGGFSAPGSLQQLNETACLANTRPLPRAPNTETTGLSLVPSLATFGALTEAFSGTLYQAEDSTFKVNSEASIAAMNYLYDLDQADCMEIESDDEQATSTFSLAESLYLLGPADEFIALNQLISENLSFSWNASGLPGLEGPSLPTILYGPNLSIPSSTPEQMVAAWMFIKFIQTSDAQRIWIQATGEYPLSRTITADFPMPAAYWKIFSELKEAPALPAYPLIGEVNQRSRMLCWISSPEGMSKPLSTSCSPTSTG